ncbi:hypothetical protein [Flavobacterium aestivum]|uniref:hypothetical protein n=1 Tax=Flavobacterium aestivum TaxID=3003257 RepID=UPI002482D397|nr:hypothetical protein [Flavobacterium aestivum]
MENFQEKLKEFKNQIKGRKIDSDTAGILLFKDFLSKMSEWNHEASFTEDWISKISRQHDLLNIVGIVAPDLLKNVISLNEFRNNDPQYGDTFNLSSARGLDAGLIYALFCWDSFKDNPVFDKYKNLPDPYDSIKALYITGHYVDRSEPTKITIDSKCIVRTQTDFRLPSLDYDFLDYIDEVCERRGSDGIPNQEKTNQLWEEFQKQKK